MHIVSRAAWGARPPRDTPIRMTFVPSPVVYVHHTAGNERGPAGMRSIQLGHQNNRGFNDIAYNFVIDGDDGVIYEGRGAGIRGGHVLGAENNNHGVCIMGNFENEVLQPAARGALVALLRHGSVSRWWQLNVRGHRQDPGIITNPDKATACPGRNLFAALPSIRAAALAAPTTPTLTPEDDEMFLYSSAGKPVFFCDGGVSVGLNELTDMPTFNNQKVKHFVLDDDTFAKFRERFPGA